jgi:predicted lipoprotein with Yx(FWY)xxD motif
MLRLRQAAILVGLALSVVACGSDSTTAPGSSSAATVPTTQAPTSAAASSAAAGGGAVVGVGTVSKGQVLVGAGGRTLYLFTADTGSQSTCTGACAQNWPPLTTTGSPTAGTGATQSLLGTSTRTDGSVQVTYNGHPLYYFASDTKAGDANGEGVNDFEMVSPAGSKL